MQAPTGLRTNERIRLSPIRLIDEDGQMAGVVETDDARRRARDVGLDLVEIAPDERPPVCRIMDFGKFKYEKSKKERAGRTKTAELKEVRLGRSMKIDPHDIEIRLKQARKFLIEGHKVQIVQNFRGREMAHKERGSARMKDIEEKLDDIARVELFPRMAGRRMTMVFAPDKQKIQLYLRANPKEDPSKKKKVTVKDAEKNAEKDAEKNAEKNTAPEAIAPATVEQPSEPISETTSEA